MKVLYIESKQKNLIPGLPKTETKKLPKKLFLAYSIQYKDLAKQIKKQLEESKIKIDKFQQVLGCSQVSTKLPILLVGTGRFHATNLYLQAPEVFLLEGNKIVKIPKAEIDKIKARKRTALIKFLKADNIGILVTTKPGQENLDKAVKLRKQIQGKVKRRKPLGCLGREKKAYIFLSNNIDISQFENFNIQSWVNTACSGLAMDNPDIINIADLPN